MKATEIVAADATCDGDDSYNIVQNEIYIIFPREKK